MPDPDTPRAKQLLFEALELQGEERASFLAALAGEAPELHARVQGLLAAHDEASGAGLDALQQRFRRVIGGAPAGADELAGDALPHLGDYEILGEIASGGAGVVYRARQHPLGREVAVKLLRAGRFASEREVERFRAEAEAVARLDHPHIVPIYEVGEVEGRHFFSMKLIEGGSLGERIGHYGRHLREAAALLAAVARAVHHGHQRGLLHRDLKPTNILIDEAGAPYVADFGIAKRLDEDDDVAALTGTGVFVGTPAYMAPEQLGASPGGARELTVGTDVYALGCVLYEILAGRPPFEAEHLAELIVRVRDQAPPPFRYDTPRALETIARKCLAKRPADRYASANALADDLERWLRHEPIEARRPGLLARALLLWRRKPLVASLVGLVGVLVVSLAVGASWASLQLNRHLRDARENLREAYLAQATALRHARHFGWREHSLERLREAAGLAAGADLRDEAIACLAAPDIDAVARMALEPGRPLLGFDAGLQLALVADGEHGALELRRVPAGDVAARLPGQGARCVSARVSDDGALVLAGYAAADGRPARVVLWDTASAAPRFARDVDARAMAFDLAADEAVLGTRDGRLLVLGLTDGAPRLELDDVEPILDLDPRGRWYACSSTDPPGAVLHDRDDGRVVARLELTLPPRALAWLRDDGRLALAGSDHAVHLWDVEADLARFDEDFAEGGSSRAAPSDATEPTDAAPRPAYLRVQQAERFDAPVSPDEESFWDGPGPDAPEPRRARLESLRGHRAEVVLLWSCGPAPLLVSSSWDGTTILWNRVTGEVVQRIQATLAGVSADGRRLAVRDHEALGLWSLGHDRAVRSLYGHEGKSPSSVAFAADGAWLASGGPDGLLVSDLARDELPLRVSDAEVAEVLFAGDGRTVYGVGAEGLRAFDLGGLRAAGGPRPVDVPSALLLDVPLRRAALSADGRVLAAGRRYGESLLLIPLDDPGAYRELLGLPALDHVSIRPDGRQVAAGTWGGRGVMVWDSVTGDTLVTLHADEHNVLPYFSADGALLVTASGGTYTGWDTSTWTTRWIHERPADVTARVGGVAFSRDGELVALAPEPGVVALVDPADGRTRVRLEAPEVLPNARMAFGGQRLAVATGSGRVLVWEFARLAEELARARLDARDEAPLPAIFGAP